MKRRQARFLVGGIVAVVVVTLLVAWSGGLGGTPQGEKLLQVTQPPGLPGDDGRLWGNPNPGLYTPVDSPRYLSSAEASAFLQDGDLVYILRRGTTTYAFPEVLMTSYHVVNAVIDDEPIAVTYCLLAGSATSFRRQVDEKVLTLGVTGELYCGNSVLYDKETGTTWLQVNGEPLKGHYHGRARLDGRPLESARWGKLKEEPGVQVLAPLRDVSEFRAFHQQMTRERFGQRVVESHAKLDPRLLPYTPGIALFVQGVATFYPEDPLAKRRLVNDQVGGWAVSVLRGGIEGASGVFRRLLGDRRLDFELSGGGFRDLQTSSRWNEQGLCISGALAGSQLAQPFFTHVYWFVWSSLYPETRIQG